MSVICLVRHGDRLDTNNYKEWHNAPRYKENSHDVFCVRAYSKVFKSGI